MTLISREKFWNDTKRKEKQKERLKRKVKMKEEIGK
jgi:hypothetical protein